MHDDYHNFLKSLDMCPSLLAWNIPTVLDRKFDSAPPKEKRRLTTKKNIRGRKLYYDNVEFRVWRQLNAYEKVRTLDL